MEILLQSDKFTIWHEPDDKNYRFFEHNEQGGDYAGGMWFENNELVDYDGVFELPYEVIKLMLDNGYDMSYCADEDNV